MRQAAVRNFPQKCEEMVLLTPRHSGNSSYIHFLKNLVMKKVAITFCTATILFACNSSTDTKTADTGETKVAAMSAGEKPKAEWIPVDSAAATKAWMETMMPVKEHAMLAKSNGTWNAETTMWMAPDAPPQKSTATAENKMILGGRFQQSTFKGSMMGQPFEGVGTMGYDVARKVYVSSWVDNMSTAVMNMEGTWDEATKSITTTGKMYCPANKMDCEMKEVFKTVDDNTQVLEMYGPDMKTGKPYKTMEIKYTRKK